MPELSVLLPVHNAAPFLDDAVASVLDQSFADFELLIQDDGSDDGSLAQAMEWAERDGRVRVFEAPHRGLVATLNELVGRSQAPFLARMDGDDIARPDRFAKQLARLKANPNILVCGSWVQTFGEKREVWHFREHSNFSRNLMLFGVTTLGHPTWMLPRRWLEQYPYDPHFEHIEDRAWLAHMAAMEPDGEFVAVPEVLLDYRIHGASVTGRHKSAQQRRTREIVARLLAAYGVELGADEFDFFCKLAFRETASAAEVAAAGAVLDYVARTIAPRLPDEHGVFEDKWQQFRRANAAAATLTLV